MTPRVKFTTILLFLSLFTALPVTTLAQIPTSFDGVEISSSPETPSPGETTEISLESYSTDLNAASIVWLVEGKNYVKGIGKKSIEIAAPLLGKSYSVTALISTVEGKEIKKTIVIKSGSVDLVWESEGYIPPLYKGKATFAYQNTVTFSAIPHLAGTNGVEIDPRTLLYKWTVNEKVIQDQSGYGKQRLTFQEDLPKPLEVLVEVSTTNGSQKGSATLTLNPGQPSVSFYEEDPLYGVLYNKAIVNKVRLANQEVSIRAVPYSFTFSKAAPLTFNWTINKLERGDLSKNESVTLRTKGNTEGTSDIDLEIRNSENILQSAKNSVSILFSKRQTQTENNVTF